MKPPHIKRILAVVLGLLTAHQTFGMVLRPSEDGPMSAAAVAVSQLPDSAVPYSIFCGSGCWNDLLSSDFPESCANDPTARWGESSGGRV